MIPTVRIRQAATLGLHCKNWQCEHLWFSFVQLFYFWHFDVSLMTDFYFFLTCYWPRMAPWGTEHELTVHFFFQKVNNTSSCNVRTSKSNLVILDFVVSVSVFCNYEFYFKRPLKRRALKIIYHWTRIISEDRDTVCPRKLAPLFPVYRNTIKIFTFQGSHPSWKALLRRHNGPGWSALKKVFFFLFSPPQSKQVYLRV